MIFRQFTRRLPKGLRNTVYPWWRVLRIAYLRFCFSGAIFMAAAIAFYSLICLGPLGILLAAALQALSGPGSDVYHRIQAGVNDLGAETAGRIMPQVDGLLANPDAHIASIVSLVAIIWAGLRLFETVERSLTEIWPGKILRGFLTRKLVALNTMLVSGLLLAGFLLFNAYFAAIRSWLGQFPEIDLSLVDQARPRFLLAYQFAMSCVAFALLYKFMPVQRVPWKVVLAGALFAGTIWLGASQVFTFMIGRSQQYGSIYGGLAGVVVFSFWAFIGSQALLVGAHFAVAYEHVFLRRHARGEDDTLIGLAQRLAEKQWAGTGSYPIGAACETQPDSSVDDNACEAGNMGSRHINGVIIAGGRIPKEFAQAVGTDSKGLIDVLGRPCIDYVIDAMRGVPGMDRLVIVGPTELYAEHPVAAKVDAVIEEGEGITGNLVNAIEALGEETPILMAVSDTPLLTSAALQDFLAQCPQDSDLCYPVTRREATEELFGTRGWVFLPLKEGWITHTCNVFFKPDVVTRNLPFIEGFIAKRRNQWTAAATVGIGFLLRFFLSWRLAPLRYSMRQIGRRIKRITGARNCTGVILDHPEMALDIDKPTDVPFVEDYLRAKQPKDEDGGQ